MTESSIFVVWLELKMNVIGPRLKLLRIESKLTQEEFATKCNLVEFDLSRSTLAKIEAQLRRVTDIELILLAKALNLPVEELLKPL